MNVHCVLHFDINETILIGDEAGGDSFQHSLNKILAKAALVQHSEQASAAATLKHFTPTHWWDGTPLSTEEYPRNHREPPALLDGWTWPAGTCPYYLTAYKHVSHRFTEPGHHGSIYRDTYNQLIHKLDDTSYDGHDDSYKPFQHILPAFFHTLHHLHRKSSFPYTIVLRTMGSDLEQVISAIQLFAKGQHPLYPDYINPNLYLENTFQKSLFRGRWKLVHNKPSSSTHDTNHDMEDWDDVSIMKDAVYQLFAWDDHQLQYPIASGDDEILNLMESQSILGIQDDYDFWNRHGKRPWAGKPIWIQEDDSPSSSTTTTRIRKRTCHAFFDDNIHNDGDESIVAIRCKKKGTTYFQSLTGHEIIQQHGKTIFKVPTVEVILNRNWFLDQIEKVFI